MSELPEPTGKTGLGRLTRPAAIPENGAFLASPRNAGGMILSLVLPGLGPVYQGRISVRSGAAFLGFTIFLYKTFVPLGLLLHALFIYDAAKARLPPEPKPKRYFGTCSECGRRFPDSDLVTHRRRLWCRRDYDAALSES